ncbi:MAG: hypothetical protein LBD50_01630 [Rickettsiales bacterium]|jgi:hypothetical protein|nr:hypothetical protein [Rickettsiales bacterium]
MKTALKIIYGIFAVIGAFVSILLVFSMIFLPSEYEPDPTPNEPADPKICAESNGVVKEDGFCHVDFCDIIMDDAVCKKIFSSMDKPPCNDPMNGVICESIKKDRMKEAARAKKVKLKF